jgi:hypothetical protein
MTDQFSNWRLRLKGETVPTHTDSPDAGFYRNRGIPVAYWFDGDQLRCHIGGKPCTDMDRANTTWPFASKQPVTKVAYDEYLKTGTWPDQHAAVTESFTGSNNPPDDDSLEGVRAAIDALAHEADLLIKKGAAKTQNEADQAADVATRLGGLWTKADNIRKVEKQPHLDAERAVDDRWRPVLTAAVIYQNIKAAVITPFLNAENAKRRVAQEAADKAAREAAAEAARKQQEIDEAHRKATAEALAKDQPLPLPPPEPPPAPPPVAQFVPASAGTRGRKVSARTKKLAKIEDYAAALASFAQHEEIKTLVQTLANKQANIGVVTPGCKIVEEGQAV